MAYSTIDKSTDYFNTKLYSGTGSTQAITGVGFQPDMTWIKCRSGTASGEDHCIFDAVRGPTKRLSPNQTTVEYTHATNITSFDSDGWTMSTNTQINGSGEYVGWNWKANGSGSANTDGQINSTVSVNTTAGFSIVKFDLTSEGAVTKTVGHGLGVVPKMIITRPLGAIGWHTWHTSLGTDYVVLNTSAAKATSGNFMNSEVPTATTFKIGDTSNGTFWNNNNCIAYCFADVAGYSKFGSYVGNGSSSGPYIHLGFSASFIMLKKTDSSDAWAMYDNKRNEYNVVNKAVEANVSNAEYTGDRLDILSNGFKQRSNNGVNNSSGGTYIYMAFGQPIISNSGVCATAR